MLKSPTLKTKEDLLGVEIEWETFTKFIIHKASFIVRLGNLLTNTKIWPLGVSCSGWWRKGYNVINSYNLTQSMISKGLNNLQSCEWQYNHHHLIKGCYQTKKKKKRLHTENARMSQLHFWIYKKIEFYL